MVGQPPTSYDLLNENGEFLTAGVARQSKQRAASPLEHNVLNSPYEETSFWGLPNIAMENGHL